MPLYEYECGACGVRFEHIQKFSDPQVEVCPSCGGLVHKLMSMPSIRFKGSGWYVNDYAQKGVAAEAGTKASEKGTNAGEKGANADATGAKPGEAPARDKNSPSGSTSSSSPSTPSTGSSSSES
jgi:putative FmdB family regulatory protein